MIIELVLTVTAVFLILCYGFQYALHGVLCTVSVWRGVRGYLQKLVVAIAKFRSCDKNKGENQHAQSSFW